MAHFHDLIPDSKLGILQASFMIFLLVPPSLEELETGNKLENASMINDTTVGLLHKALQYFGFIEYLRVKGCYLRKIELCA